MGSGVPMECSSVFHFESQFDLPHMFRMIHHWLPFYSTEHVADGFVHRWIRVRQGPVQAVIARVGILTAEKSERSIQRTWIRRVDAIDNELYRDRTCPVPAERAGICLWRANSYTSASLSPHCR